MRICHWKKTTLLFCSWVLFMPPVWGMSSGDFQAKIEQSKSQVMAIDARINHLHQTGVLDADSFAYAHKKQAALLRRVEALNARSPDISDALEDVQEKITKFNNRLDARSR